MRPLAAGFVLGAAMSALHLTTCVRDGSQRASSAQGWRIFVALVTSLTLGTTVVLEVDFFLRRSGVIASPPRACVAMLGCGARHPLFAAVLR